MSEWYLGWRDFFAPIGLSVVAFFLAAGAYHAAVSAFYDPAFDEGFNAGRKSMYEDCYVNGKTYKCYPPRARGEAQ